MTGKQTYRINYTVRGALNPFAEHDELFWNVNGGDWDVPMRVVTATVHSAFDAFTSVTCYEGPRGSTKACRSSFSPRQPRSRHERPARGRPAHDRDRAAQGRGDGAGTDASATRP